MVGLGVDGIITDDPALALRCWGEGNDCAKFGSTFSFFSSIAFDIAFL